jgi:hypothetical protein
VSGPRRPVARRASARTLAAAAIASAALLPAVAGGQSLRGSKASIARMHSQAVEHGLHFYETATGARQAAGKGRFRRLAGNADYRVHQVSFPYVTDETALFVERLASQYRKACGEQMVVTSALRPESRQPRNSTDLSVHPTGMAVDLRKPTKGSCLRFLRTTLLALEEEGVLEATEERRPPHFHVAVFPRPYVRYVGAPAARLAAASAEPAVERPAHAPRATTRTAPAVQRHRVRSGDTLWDLARRYGTTVKRIRQTNNLASSALRPGQQIVIPNG